MSQEREGERGPVRPGQTRHRCGPGVEAFPVSSRTAAAAAAAVAIADARLKLWFACVLRNIDKLPQTAAGRAVAMT